MRIALKRPGAVILSLALAACSAPPPKQPATPEPPGQPATPGRPAGPRHPVAPAPARPPEESLYRIDPAQSELRVLVYRAGPMASLGHNHVISCHSVQGWATLGGGASSGAFALSIPVTSFVVDDPALRAQEGSDFVEGVTDEARAGTLHNMLGPALLNAVGFPALTIRSLSVTAEGGTWQARLSLEVGGHVSTLAVPFVLEVSPGRVSAGGELELTQSSIGLTPFSVFLGALKVRDDLRVKFKFVAIAG